MIFNNVIFSFAQLQLSVFPKLKMMVIEVAQYYD